MIECRIINKKDIKDIMKTIQILHEDDLIKYPIINEMLTLLLNDEIEKFGKLYEENPEIIMKFFAELGSDEEDEDAKEDKKMGPG